MESEDLPLGTELEEEEKMKSKAMQETSTPKFGGPILAQKVLIQKSGTP